MGRESNKARDNRRRVVAETRRERGQGAIVCAGVEVLRWAHGGDAVVVPEVGPLVGRIVFLESAVPGDVVDIEVNEVKERWGRGRVLRVVSASPERRPAKCAVQATCGGCPWMIGSAAAQARSREAILRGEVRKVLGDDAVAVVEMAEPAEPGGADLGGEFGYRQRLRLGYSIGPYGVKLGFRSRRSHELVDIERCEVAAESLNGALGDVREALRARAVGEIGRVTLLAGREGASGRSEQSGVAGWIEPERGAGVGFGLEAVELELGRFRQVLGPRSFTQANAGVTGLILERLVEWGRGFAGAGRGGQSAHAVELFAGSGTLTMALWEAGFAVTAYEGDGRARAAFERTRAGREAVWHEADLEQGFPWPAPDVSALGPVEIVVLDPPRTGARALMPWVRASGAKAVAYLSCDLATGLRDCAELTASGGGPYVVESIIGYDMFPHSGHQEVLLLLRKSPTR